ncbi:MAG: NAD(P)H-dependent oxidoreductase [Myxococcota bacterium]
MPELHVVITSTRPSRQGPSVARWFADQARAHGGFEVVPVDLADIGLPLLDEPEHPRLRKYQHPHTIRWSQTVDRADAFVFVTPEYNYGTPPALVNALDYLVHEWAYKPVGFVSYGGISAGTRSSQMTKQLVTTLKMMPVPEQVSLPFFQKFVGPDGTFTPEPAAESAARAMLTELARWEQALRSLRRPG